MIPRAREPRPLLTQEKQPAEEEAGEKEPRRGLHRGEGNRRGFSRTRFFNSAYTSTVKRIVAVDLGRSIHQAMANLACHAAFKVDDEISVAKAWIIWK